MDDFVCIINIIRCLNIHYYKQLTLFQLNVVGTKRIKGIRTCTMEDLQWVLDGNIKVTFMMTQACLPYLEESKGQIINMSSFSGSRPVSYQPSLAINMNPL